MSSDTPNPHEIRTDEVNFGPDGEIILSPTQRRGFVAHVPIVGGLMITQGVLEVLLGCLFGGMAIFGQEIVAQMTSGNPAVQQMGWTDEQMRLGVSLLYGAIGLGLFILAAITIFAGWKTLRYENRTVGQIGLGVGFASLVLGCYCFPTSLILGIYGLIALNDGAVKIAYELRKAGYSPKQIRQVFKSLP